MLPIVKAIFVLPLLVFIISCGADAQAVTENSGSFLEVLDFHNEHRCATCLKIESNTRKILSDFYSKEVQSGIITFRLINVDEKANDALVKKFQAYGTTLIVYTVKDGKESIIDLTSFAFMNFDNPEKFADGLRKEIDAGLKKVNP